MGVYVHGYHQFLPSVFKTEQVSVIKNLSFKSGELEPDINDPFYPNRSDVKIMRSDVIASILSINHLLSKFNSTVSREDFSLFTASGVFIEKIENHTKHLVKVYQEITETTSTQEVLQKIYRGSPPLLALQTLTNSAMSFIAQYTGIKGNNFTFGTTSASGFHAIKAGFDQVLFEKGIAVAAGANVAGAHSFLMNMPFRLNSENWFESASAASLILSDNSENAICAISEIKSSTVTGTLSEKRKESKWNIISEKNNADALLISGAFTSQENQDDINWCNKFYPHTLSAFDQTGNTGSCNAFNSIIQGIKLIQQGKKRVDIADRDIYGVEHLVTIKAVQ